MINTKTPRQSIPPKEVRDSCIPCFRPRPHYFFSPRRKKVVLATEEKMSLRCPDISYAVLLTLNTSPSLRQNAVMHTLFPQKTILTFTSFRWPALSPFCGIHGSALVPKAHSTTVCLATLCVCPHLHARFLFLFILRFLGSCCNQIYFLLIPTSSCAILRTSWSGRTLAFSPIFTSWWLRLLRPQPVYIYMYKTCE